MDEYLSPEWKDRVVLALAILLGIWAAIKTCRGGYHAGRKAGQVYGWWRHPSPLGRAVLDHLNEHAAAVTEERVVENVITAGHVSAGKVCVERGYLELPGPRSIPFECSRVFVDGENCTDLLTSRDRRLITRKVLVIRDRHARAERALKEKLFLEQLTPPKPPATSGPGLTVVSAVPGPARLFWG